MHSPERASEAVISLDRIRSLLANASGRVEFYTPGSVIEKYDQSGDNGANFENFD